MNNDEIVIDELKICYVTAPNNLDPLEKIEVGKYLDYLGYRFYRLTNERFRFFYVILDKEGDVGHLKFGHYTDTDDAAHHVYLKVLNPILYQEDRRRRLLELPKLMGLSFNNFTAIDLAFDTTTNVTTLIKRMMRNDKIKTIFNGKAIQDRKAIIQGISFQYSTTLNRLSYPSITFKQKKAVNKKDEGITVQAYDKKAEIDHHSDKRYILDHYSNPKRLYRLEVRLRYRELKEYFSSRLIVADADVIQDMNLLKEMFIYHLTSVIRFSQGRKKIKWSELLNMQ